MAVDTAVDVADKIQNGSVALDVQAIKELVSQKLSGSEESMNIATIALVICWILGIADSYWRGRTQEKVEEVAAEKKL